MTHADILLKPSKNNKNAFLGFGAMRLPGIDETIKMTDAYMEAGFNYFDTAYMYGSSEGKLKQALVARYPRDAYMVADKIPPWEVKNQKDCERIFNESLRRSGLDYFDFYLVHSLDEENEQKAVKAGVYEWAAGQKKKGLVKHVGFSFHGSTELLEAIFKDHPEMEFVQLQLNYSDVLRGQGGKWQEMALRYDKPIIVMEPVKGGMLARLPKTAETLMKTHSPMASIASWAMRYAGALQGVTCVLGGMSSMAQMKDNIGTYNPLTQLDLDEMAVIETVLLEMAKNAAIPCTACKYCMPYCPQQIDIATCLSLFNGTKLGAAGWNQKILYDNLPNGADKCTDCGVCLPRCPQKIDIPKALKETVRAFR